jgi:protein-S-isoprenylcysteine O-methyltransferase Ste14
MIDALTTAILLTGLVVLFFSVHAYMDIRMFRQKNARNPQTINRSEFIIPLWAKILAFPPSIVFWILFIGSPLLFYSGLYEKAFSPVLFRGAHETLVQSAGFILILAGVLLADWGRISRGLIAPSGPMPEDYSLSTCGAYGIVRHPMYLSYFLFFVGLPLALLNMPLFLCIVGIPGYYGIAREEERILIGRFGEQYKEYQKEVGMFAPKL